MGASELSLSRTGSGWFDKISGLLDRTEFLLFGIIFLGVCLRTIGFPNNPPGLFSDEASAGYETLSLLRTGTDSWGVRLPVYFLQSGLGQNVLYSYLGVPIVGVLGLSRFSTRLMNVILGILTLPLLYVSARRAYGKNVALVSTLLLAILPWHVMLSRWGLDSSPLPFFLMLGTYLVQRALTRDASRLMIVLALVPWGLCLYAYIVATVVVPVILGLLILFYFDTMRRDWRAWVAAFAVFGLIAMPMLAFLFKNLVSSSGLPFERLIPFGISLLPFSRLDQVSIPLATRLEENLSILLAGFQDGDLRANVPGIAPMFLVLFPLACVGIGYLVRRYRETREADLFLILLVASAPVFVLYEANTHRVLATLIPMIAIGAYGLDRLTQALAASRRAQTVLVAGVSVLVAIQAGLFVYEYFWVYPTATETIESFYTNYDRALATGLAAAKPDEAVLITQLIPIPHLVTAFYESYPPDRYQRDIRFNIAYGTAAFSSLGRFYFGTGSLPDREQPFTFVLDKREAKPCDKPERLLETKLWQVGKCNVPQN